MFFQKFKKAMSWLEWRRDRSYTMKGIYEKNFDHLLRRYGIDKDLRCFKCGKKLGPVYIWCTKNRTERFCNTGEDMICPSVYSPAHP